MVRRRLLAWVLILYGVLGLVLVVGGAAIGLDVAARVERLTATADGTLAAAARSIDVAAEAFTNVDASLSESQESADAAAELARDASGTMASLAQAMELSVFGAQPLLPLAAEFDASAEQATALAETLDGEAGSLSDTRADVASIGTELAGLTRSSTPCAMRTTRAGRRHQCGSWCSCCWPGCWCRRSAVCSFSWRCFRSPRAAPSG